MRTEISSNAKNVDDVRPTTLPKTWVHSRKAVPAIHGSGLFGSDSPNAGSQETLGPAESSDESGYILVVSLVVMILLAIIALSLLGSNTIQELLAGNLSQKTRALQAANSALNYAEGWVAQNPSAGIACKAGTTSSTPVVCNINSPALGTLDPNDLTVPTSDGAAIGTIFQPTGMIASTSGTNTVYQLPRYYIQYVGLVSDSAGTVTGSLYKITAAGYGGNANAVAIVQAYYRVYSQATDVMGP